MVEAGDAVEAWLSNESPQATPCTQMLEKALLGRWQYGGEVINGEQNTDGLSRDVGSYWQADVDKPLQRLSEVLQPGYEGN